MLGLGCVEPVGNGWNVGGRTEIAGRTVISRLTAKTHVGNILPKLGCRDRAALVALAPR